ncbi:MAG: hypothetical protein AAF202_07085 [Pseudomonadota bacterium]
MSVVKNQFALVGFRSALGIFPGVFLFVVVNAAAQVPKKIEQVTLQLGMTKTLIVPGLGKAYPRVKRKGNFEQDVGLLRFIPSKSAIQLTAIKPGVASLELSKSGLNEFASVFKIRAEKSFDPLEASVAKKLSRLQEVKVVESLDKVVLTGTTKSPKTMQKVAQIVSGYDALVASELITPELTDEDLVRQLNLDMKRPEMKIEFEKGKIILRGQVKSLLWQVSHEKAVKGLVRAAYLNQVTQLTPKDVINRLTVKPASSVSLSTKE